ncbi:hypothetical protein Ahy_A05g024350 [Arachis hypogaea]|uniref:Uncharacterized protein n=1 Tax=Arachis hypogaea TaxID=3818 RepID=A0A445D5Y0_ARAHY|nr:hypothetical protein Ahy_A05g024350 [Arachis hypogaea]
MGTNMYPSSSLLGQSKDAAVSSLLVDELIEKDDGFARVFPSRDNIYLSMHLVLCQMFKKVTNKIAW